MVILKGCILHPNFNFTNGYFGPNACEVFQDFMLSLYPVPMQRNSFNINPLKISTYMYIRQSVLGHHVRAGTGSPCICKASP